MSRERRDRLRTLLPGQRLLVTDLADVRYLTGFSGSNAVLVVDRDGADLLGTDGRYRDQVAEQAPDLPVVIDRDTVSAVLGAVGPGSWSVQDGASLAVWGEVRALGVEPDVTSGLVAGLRAIKDAGELEALARACAITAEAMSALLAELRPGMTEVGVARRLEQLFGELGAEDRAFDTIVAGGAHAAIPHHEPGRRPLAVGDLVVIDAGARVDGYHADMTRTVVVGRDPEPWQREIHALVLAAQTAATDRYRPGAALRDVDAAARGVIEDAGYGVQFTHGLGHGVGLVIHEAPMVGPRATGTMDADMAITVEPGIYLAGQGGVRIEDTLVVTDSGPRVLTPAPRDLLVVG